MPVPLPSASPSARPSGLPPAKMRTRTASGASSGDESDDGELKQAYVNCVAASDLPDVKGFRGSINPYLVMKWCGEEIKKVTLLFYNLLTVLIHNYLCVRSTIGSTMFVLSKPQGYVIRILSPRRRASTKTRSQGNDPTRAPLTVRPLRAFELVILVVGWYRWWRRGERLGFTFPSSAFSSCLIVFQVRYVREDRR